MPDREDVCVLIPTLNEAETIGEVIDGFREQGFSNVLVVDGNSDDGTRDVATDHGARVIQQSGVGKGQAVREGLDHIEAEYVLMLDGDGTYKPGDADTMLAPLDDGYDHVIGNRFSDMDDGSMPRLNHFGNRIINEAFAVIHRSNFKDILSGYRAFTRKSAERAYLTSDGFGVETELAVECVKHSVPTAVVPVQYEERPDDSETNLHPLWDGGDIIMTLYQLAKTNNPLFYFGSMGFVSGLFGVFLGAYVGVEWVTRHISHEVLAIVAGVSIIFGLQLLMFGVLSDMIVTLHREQMRRIEERR
ncbi:MULTISPECIES: S-layer glycoprotein N-glycosyltransferase AglJ [unclassified Haladaptatus]|uniref:S-layer glycoprotein N-glycosyltransferase AglJ n=1 Tax=unclassified Haladaptatus TaxID=2622732 RepID=UPI00209C305A|nr:MULTISPECIES: S-layer glycoprotein N-glycosyltransferase AglJ [unclassified Haladaptatus]MCO8246069.1 S-layer glycoprotein N-glycosyltransferase AglJ [Haladaptatus sp. AB643]MCO8254311.1 S-layer glycoprotein N-glycosyltransferase AglJ [Haladaptatus sp. AB618]